MIRTLLTTAALVAALAGCSAGTDSETPAQPATVLQLDLPVIPPADTPDGSAGCGDYCGTDAGLIPPAPAVEQLVEAQPRHPGVTTASPAPAPVAAAPVVPAPVEEMPAPEHVQEQLPEETNGRQIDCPDGTVGTMQDGTLNCGSAE